MSFIRRNSCYRQNLLVAHYDFSSSKAFCSSYGVLALLASALFSLLILSSVCAASIYTKCSLFWLCSRRMLEPRCLPVRMIVLMPSAKRIKHLISLPKWNFKKWDQLRLVAYNWSRDLVVAYVDVNPGYELF